MTASDPTPEPGSVPTQRDFPAQRVVDHDARPLSFYVHVPFCAVRCGYCDFNTYTPAQLPGMSMAAYLSAVHREIAQAARSIGTDRPLATVFFGGGTPTMATPEQLGAVLDDLRDTFALAPDCEITTEANPETVGRSRLERLAQLGFTRVSLGMQSADEAVLATLDRRHTPGQALRAVEWAHAAGFDDVSLDLIYGTPGETLDSWRASLESALSVEPEHVSAYSLIVEPGTALARRIRLGELPEPDEDFQADEYLLASELLSSAGLENYEISNWARPGHRARHNLAYWRSWDWWGIGPGAHSHVNGVRWWNVKHPRRYAAQLAHDESPREDFEELDEATRHEERVLLELRISDGLSMAELSADELERVRGQIARGLVVRRGDHVMLSPAGRLLGDAVTRDILA